METVLVTGGAGFIGSHLAERLLAEGKRVIVVDDFNDFYDPKLKRANAAALAANGATIIEADITDAQALAAAFTHKIDAVIHLAARAGVRPSIAHPLLYAQVNIQGTLNVLEQCRKHGINRFIFGSSSSVYGTNSKVPFSEDDPVSSPISPYATSKLAGEHYCKVYHQLFGMHITCLRFFTVYGPRGRPDMAVHKFTEAIVTGKPIDVYAEGKLKRDFTYVSDIVEGIIAALERNLPFEIINLGDANPITVQELMTLIEQALGKRAKINALPMQQGDVPITYADLAHAKQVLGYSPKVKIEEGIPKFVTWFKEQRR